MGVHMGARGHLSPGFCTYFTKEKYLFIIMIAITRLTMKKYNFIAFLPLPIQTILIHSFITEIYIAPLKGYYSEALPTLAHRHHSCPQIISLAK